MIFKELIQSNEWYSVSQIFLELYPNHEKSLNGYENVFYELRNLEPINSDVQIQLENYGEYVDVSGFKPNDEYSWAIEFRPWNEWLGMEVFPKTLEVFTELEIICHCLFEMTFFGFEEEEIQDQYKEINDLKEEYDNLSKEEKNDRTTSIEDLLKDIEENSENEDET